MMQRWRDITSECPSTYGLLWIAALKLGLLALVMGVLTWMAWTWLERLRDWSYFSESLMVVFVLGAGYQVWIMISTMARVERCDTQQEKP
jgi:hypothetical protein